MVVVLHPEHCEEAAKGIAADLGNAYSGNLEVVVMPASAPFDPNVAPSWDNLLLVLFDGSSFPDAGCQFIEAYREKVVQDQDRMVLPVAMVREHQKPPKPADEIKALDYDATATGAKGRLVRRVGAMLGLRVQTRGTKIFISYRTFDGAKIATQLYDHLKSHGYQPWRDQALEFDQEPTILPGSAVQKQIDDALDDADLVLLVDTPTAPHSIWIKHEVDTANALLLPILPLCFRDETDAKKGPRFRSLLDLQRWVELKNPAFEQELEPPTLDHIVAEMETYLAEIFAENAEFPSLSKRNSSRVNSHGEFLTGAS